MSAHISVWFHINYVLKDLEYFIEPKNLNNTFQVAFLDEILNRDKKRNKKGKRCANTSSQCMEEENKEWEDMITCTLGQLARRPCAWRQCQLTAYNLFPFLIFFLPHAHYPYPHVSSLLFLSFLFIYFLCMWIW